MILDGLFEWLPVEEPVVVFTLALAVFLVAPLLTRRAGLPGSSGSSSSAR